jgi:prepilin peptidase CpaA
MLQVFVLVAFPLAMIVAAMCDLLTMTISNKLSFSLALGMVVGALLGGLTFHDLFLHISSGLLVLSVCFVLFALGWIGGGDAKLAAATSAWLGFGALPEYALHSALYGGLLTLGLLAFRAVPLPGFALGWTWLMRLHDRTAGVPYGIALAAAGLVVYPASPLWRAAF